MLALIQLIYYTINVNKRKEEQAMSITQVNYFIEKLIEKRRTAQPDEQQTINHDLTGFYNLKNDILKKIKRR